MLFAAKYPSRTNGLILYGGLISPALHNAVTGVFADQAGAWEIMRQVWGNGQFLSAVGHALGNSEQSGPVAAGGVHDRPHVVRAQLECQAGRVGYRVGKAGPAQQWPSSACGRIQVRRDACGPGGGQLRPDVPGFRSLIPM